MKLTAWVFAGLIVGFFGCASEHSDTGDPTPPWRSGQRVRARVATAPDGFVVRTGWRDTSLALDCTSSSVFPLCGAVPVADGPYFADPDCTIPALMFELAVESTGYAVRRAGDDLRLFRVPTGGGPYAYFVADSGSCIPGDGLELFPALEELPLDTLARWRPVTGLGGDVDALDTADGALDVLSVGGGDRRIATTDTRLRLITEVRGGASAIVGIFDAKRDHECRLELTADGAIRCVPGQDTFAWGYYRDAACRERLWASDTPGTVLTRDRGVITAVEDYQTPAPPPIYARDETTCHPLSGDRFVATETTPLEDFEALTLAVE